MAEKKEDTVVEAVEQPKVDDTVEKIKIKKPKIKKFEQDNKPVKIDLSKPVEEKSEDITKVDLTEDKTEEVKEEVVDKPVETEQVLEEVTQEEVKIDLPPKPELPESVEKLVSFMKETGGDINDYINLN